MNENRFEVGGVVYIAEAVSEDPSYKCPECDGCAFDGHCQGTPSCMAGSRADGQFVIFIKEV
ncbi:MAG: hypothetical protein ACRCUS_00950 [Anaerovoracaceae bacterium]